MAECRDGLSGIEDQCAGIRIEHGLLKARLIRFEVLLTPTNIFRFAFFVPKKARSRNRWLPDTLSHTATVVLASRSPLVFVRDPFYDGETKGVPVWRRAVRGGLLFGVPVLVLLLNFAWLAMRSWRGRT
jgi:hypothetical protein